MDSFSHLRIEQGRWRTYVSAFVLMAAVSLPATLVTSAYAQDGDVDSRLSRMERDIDTLSRTVYKGDKLPAGTPLPGSGGGAAVNPALQAQMDDRLTRIEQDLRDLTGRVEEQGNTLSQVKTQIDRTLPDLQMRVGNMEQKLGLAPAPLSGDSPAPVVTPTAATPATPMGTTPPAPVPATASQTAPSTTPANPNGPAPESSPTVKPLGSLTNSAATGAPVAPSAGDPTQDYENAMSLLKQRDYPLAEKSLTAFIKANGAHPLATNAKYWLGETYFAQNKYEQAARIFAEGYQASPKGPKAADNLLKLGLSLSALNNKTDACVALQQIGKDFPNGANAVNTRAAQEIKKLKCGE